MDQYKVTAEECDAKAALITANIEVLKCERAIWLINKLQVNQGKDVYVKGNMRKAVKKNSPVPVEFLIPERFIARQEIEKMLLKEEVSVIIFDLMLKEFDEGNFVLYDDETECFRIIKKDQPIPVLW